VKFKTLARFKASKRIKAPIRILPQNISLF